MACIFTHIKHVVRFQIEIFRMPSLLCYEMRFQTCFPSIKLHPDWNCACAQWIWGGNSLSLPLASHEWKEEIYKAIFELEIVSKRASDIYRESERERERDRRKEIKTREFLISCRCLMIITGINFKRKQENRFLKGRKSFVVVIPTATSVDVIIRLHTTMLYFYFDIVLKWFLSENSLN